MDEPNPPDGLPEDVATALRGLDGPELREAIVYAQERLRALHEPFSPVEPLDGEEIVRIDEYDGYVEVHKRKRSPDGTPGDTYVYHVTAERHPDGTTRHHWTLIGREEHGE